VKPLGFLVPALVFAFPAQGATPVLTDAQTEALARKALATSDPEEKRAALAALKAHHFKSSLAKEREFVLYAQGLLEDRLGDGSKAAITFLKLEHTWPSSPYLAEAQVILASAAVDRRRFKEAENRLKKCLQSDLPVENKRKAQELLLWTLVEQDRAAEGIPILKSLFPHSENEKPTERGLTALVEVLCLAKDRAQAEGACKDLHLLYPNSPLGPRADLAWGRLLGAQGESKSAAEVFRKLILDKPGTPEADEAKLALATLLSEGKLQPKEIEGYPTVQHLLDDLKHSDRKGDLGRRRLLVQLRMQMNDSHWKDAVDTASDLRRQNPSADQTALATKLRAEAFQAWTQQSLDAKAVGPLLTYLDREGVEALSAQQRVVLATRLAQTGLSSAVQTLMTLAPAKEREGLRKAALDALPKGTQPEDTLVLLPAKAETTQEALRRAQALISLHRWAEAKNPLGRAVPGEDRIAALLTYLRRPPGKDGQAAGRLQEAATWLAQAREKGTVREPLAILVADLRAKTGDWRGALALYPEEAAAENRGWVALMRATCQLKLGHKDAAKSILKSAVDVPGFKMERQTLAKQLGM